MEFNGNVSGNVPANVTFRWTLSDEGEIRQGQGTLRLRVQTPRKLEFNIFATLEVLGLPVGCPTTASENAPVMCECIPILIDEFSLLPLGKQLIRLDSAVAEFHKYPESKLHIIEYFSGRASEQIVTQRVSWISAQLKKRRLLPQEFYVVISEASNGKPFTKIYILPPGAVTPAP